MQPGQGIANRGYSLIQDCGYYSSDCGYCKEEGTTVSTGMHAHRLTVYDYQELLDQGWRRSGKFLYKPDNQTTCCRQYTIRLDVTEYQPTKAHRKLMRKWEQYLAGTHSHEQQAGQQQGAAASKPAGGSSSSSSVVGQTSNSEQLDRQTASPKRARTDGSGAADHHQQQQQQHSSSQSIQQLEQIRSLLQAAVSELQNACSSGCDVSTQLLPAVRVLPVPQQQQQQHHKHKPAWPPGTVFTSPCALALAAAVRKHNSQGQQQQQQQSALLSLQAGMNGISSSSKSSSSSSLWVQPEQLAEDLADRFNSFAANAQVAVAFTAAASKGHINFITSQQRQDQQHQDGSSVAQQDSSMQAPPASQQQGRHQSNRAALSHKQAQEQQQGQQQQQQQQQQPHQLEVRMVPNQFIQEEFLLWQRYQAQQHHESLEDLTPKHYKAFLVDTPLIPVLPPPRPAPAAAVAAQAAGQQQQQQQQAGAAPGMPSCGYGSFHQQYWLDGKLVAVGVVDVLPRCLSSKYFFWDPDYAWLSLGRYGALREISWVAAQHTAGAPDFRYYYLGYYIHTCPKMAYKAEYPPSELLCPQRQVWVRMDDTVRAAFDRAPYVVLSDLPGVQMRPNLSVPRQPPSAAAAAAAGQGGGEAPGAGAGVPPVLAQAQHMGVAPQQVQQRQQERQALDSQLLFVMKQPVRWGALRTSGLLKEGDIGVLEEELSAWRAAVGETARTLLYATAQDMMSF